MMFQDGDYVLFEDLDESSFEQTVGDMYKSGFKRGFPLSFDENWNVLGIVDGEICTFQIGSPRWYGITTNRSPLMKDRPASKPSLFGDTEDTRVESNTGDDTDKARIRELDEALRSITASHADLMNYVAIRAVENNEDVKMDFRWAEDIENKAIELTGMTYIMKAKERSKV